MRLIPAAIACLLLARAALAHEFWIAPESYAIAPKDEMVANLRVGQDFAGSPMSYFPSRFERFEIRMGETTRPVEGRLGDLPAMRMNAENEGLAVVVHQTAGETLQYRTRDLFEHFVEEKDLGDVLERHADRGLPELEFREAYTRYAKSLIAVGDGAGADAPVGLHIEIVALANPYTDDTDGGLPVEVLYDGAPLAQTQVELFARAPDGSVSKQKYRTDDAGQVRLTLQPDTEFLVDCVVMEDTGNDDPEAGPVWHSAWASLTFRTR